MNLDELRTRRVGLVLAGGGAKGAYHIGCWKALRAAGLDRFAAIAGSSVGAINAVFIGANRFEAAEEAWKGLGMRDVVGFSLKSGLRLPAWLIAALGSEFSPFKITRLSDRAGNGRTAWIHPLVCAALAAALWAIVGQQPEYASGAPVISAIPLALAALVLAHHFTRPVFLRPVLTNNGPQSATLDRLLSDADVLALRESGRPIYGVLSRHTPGRDGADRWGGWSPRYVRLDHAADAASLRQILLDGSAVPGVMCGGSVAGRPVLDGAWTDNVPVAPLLFDDDHDLDVIVVVYLKPRARLTPRHNSLAGVLRVVISDALAPGRSHGDLQAWALERWKAYCAARDAAAPAASPSPSRPNAQEPLIISVAPSRRVGNFITGTLWFSGKKSACLMELGERDMRRALERLDGAMGAPADDVTARRRRRGTPAAAPQPALASHGPSTASVRWPSLEPEVAESATRT
jgi:predicted acylesterase/phospholipase RssA